MASQSSSTAWWTRDKKASLEARIQAVQRINDPTTNADELLKGSKILIVILLAFSGVLGGIAYYRFFSNSFPIEVAIGMAAALTFAIEYGKNYCAKWTIRIPFFNGWGYIRKEREHTVLWVGLFLVAIATFTMSIINSTRGGRQLSIMMSEQRDITPFTANTIGIDTLIAATQHNIDEASQVKWKGTTTRSSQKAIISHSASIESLNRQRETLIAQQRDDWEKDQARKASNRTFAADFVLASGGWVELLQVLFIFLRVACERILDRRNPTSHEQEEKSGIGFKQSGYRFAGAEHAPQPPSPDQEQPRRPIGFHRREQPLEQPTVPQKNAVEQCSTAKTAGTAPAEQSTVPTTAASVLADVKDWQKRATQCFHRALNQQREEFRQDNWQRCTCFCIMLQAVGVEVTRDDERMILQFKEPATYRTDDTVIAVIHEQKSRLDQITEKRRKP